MQSRRPPSAHANLVAADRPAADRDVAATVDQHAGAYVPIRIRERIPTLEGHAREIDDDVFAANRQRRRVDGLTKPERARPVGDNRPLRQPPPAAAAGVEGETPPAVSWGAVDCEAALAGTGEPRLSLASFVGAGDVTVGRVTPPALGPALRRAVRAAG